MRGKEALGRDWELTFQQTKAELVVWEPEGPEGGGLENCPACGQEVLISGLPSLHLYQPVSAPQELRVDFWKVRPVSAQGKLLGHDKWGGGEPRRNACLRALT